MPTSIPRLRHAKSCTSPSTTSTFDVLAAALDRRRCDCGGGVSVVSFDNLPGNGTAAADATLIVADRIAPALAE
jgi:mannitol-1-phosphate/altronate dehydrogenase